MISKKYIAVYPLWFGVEWCAALHWYTKQVCQVWVTAIYCAPQNLGNIEPDEHLRMACGWSIPEMNFWMVTSEQVQLQYMYSTSRHTIALPLQNLTPTCNWKMDQTQSDPVFNFFVECAGHNKMLTSPRLRPGSCWIQRPKSVRSDLLALAKLRSYTLPRVKLQSARAVFMENRGEMWTQPASISSQFFTCPEEGKNAIDGQRQGPGD